MRKALLAKGKQAALKHMQFSESFLRATSLKLHTTMNATATTTVAPINKRDAVSSSTSSPLSTSSVTDKSLLILVLTYPRPNNQALLVRTIKALQEQVLFFACVHVCVLFLVSSLAHDVYFPISA
jgi:hypothetical protein